MKERLFRILNIKTSESCQVFDLVAVQFFLGLAISFLNIVAFSLFIYNFPIKSLPVVYLSAAFLLLFFTILYEHFEERLTSTQLLKTVILFSVFFLLLLWTGLSFGNTHDFIFILLMGNTLVYMVISFAFWGFVSILFNVRESRRVFSIVGAGDIPAKMIGYLVAPLLIPVLGLVNMIWLSIFFLVTAFLLFSEMIGKKKWEQLRNKAYTSLHIGTYKVRHKDFFGFFFKEKLIFTISLLSILSYNVFIFIDYTFISQVKVKFENLSDLAVYIATFFAIGRIIAFLFKLLFTSRLIERIGIIYCLLITPVVLFLFCVFFIAYGGHDDYNVFILGSMALLTEVLRSAMQEPVFLILFQPLKEQLRLKGHIITKGYMMGPSLIVVGLSLLFLNNLSTPLTILLTIKIILLNLFVWVVIIFFIQKAYRKTVHSTIQKGLINNDDFVLYDAEAINILLKKVNSSNKIEVIYALNLLEKAAYADFDQLLWAQLTTEADPDIKKYVINELERKRQVDVAHVKKILECEQVEEVREKLMSVLCKHDFDFLKNISESISDQKDAIKKIIIINLLNQQEFGYWLKAAKALNGLIEHADAKQRELALNIISKVKHVQFLDVIEKYLCDPDISVRRRATDIACKLKLKTLLPAILERSNLPSNKYLVLRALHFYGDTLFQDILSLTEGGKSKYMPELIKIAGNTKGPHSTRFLLDALREHSGTSNSVVHALWNKKYDPQTSEELKNLKMLLLHYLNTGISKIGDYHALPYINERDMLRKSLFAEVKSDLDLALKLSVLVFKKKDINRVLELVNGDGNVKVFNAMEMLELLLPQKISKDLNILIDFLLEPNNNRNSIAMENLDDFVGRVFVRDAPHFNSWTKAVCIYCSWKNNKTDWIKTISSEQLMGEDQIVKETWDYVLDKIK